MPKYLTIMVHKPICPGSLRLMCLRMISQAIYSYLDARPRLEKYFQLCGPQCKNETSKLINYITTYFPSNLRDLLLEFLTQLWFSKLLKMKQKTIGRYLLDLSIYLNWLNDMTSCKRKLLEIKPSHWLYLLMLNRSNILFLGFPTKVGPDKLIMSLFFHWFLVLWMQCFSLIFKLSRSIYLSLSLRDKDKLTL